MPADLSSLGTQLQLQPSTTRSEFKIAYDRLIVKDSGRCLDCWEAMFYAPFAPDSERALLESIAQSGLNDTGLQFQNPMPALPNALPNGTQPSPIQLEYIPIYYIEPLDFINRVGETTTDTVLFQLFVCVACFLLKVKDRFEDLRNVFILF